MRGVPTYYHQIIVFGFHRFSLSGVEEALGGLTEIEFRSLLNVGHFLHWSELNHLPTLFRRGPLHFLLKAVGDIEFDYLCHGLPPFLEMVVSPTLGTLFSQSRDPPLRLPLGFLASVISGEEALRKGSSPCLFSGTIEGGRNEVIGFDVCVSASRLRPGERDRSPGRELSPRYGII